MSTFDFASRRLHGEKVMVAHLTRAGQWQQHQQTQDKNRPSRPSPNEQLAKKTFIGLFVGPSRG